MKRIIDHFLLKWKHDRRHKALILRGARQVGKTYAVRKLGETYPDFVEINFELYPEATLIFEKNLDPNRILRELSLLVRKQIIPGQALLFLDEVQMVPQAIIALRYFYENLPELDVIAAGSLLDFAIEKVGIPVGRVQSLYMYPVSFMEYLAAMGESLVIDAIMHQALSDEMSPVIHDKILNLLGEYSALGGMPDVIAAWISTKNPLNSSTIHRTLLDTYRQDFGKYTKKLQVKYVELIFDQIPQQLGRKFKYSIVEGEYRKRELAPALDLLVTAGVAHKVFYSSGQGIPLGAQIDTQDYRVILLDLGLVQSALGLELSGWFLNPTHTLINTGSVVEALVGQELLVYRQPDIQHTLHYWHKESRTDQAEIDYLIQLQGSVIPVEVKAGLGRTLRSLTYFLDKHPKSTYGIRFSAQNYSIHNQVHSYPLYAIAKVMCMEYAEVRSAIEALLLD